MILRVCIVITTYSDSRSRSNISEIVRDVVQMSPFPILIVDDGSETPVEDSLYPWSVREAIEQKRVRVVRFERSQGKGAALQFAIAELVKQGFTHMLTVDADGQHPASEIHKLVEAGLQHPWDLIIGHRSFQGGTGPGRLGQRISNFWVRYQTGLQIQDSQSGFRLYPLFSVQNLKFFTRRFEFEVEILIRSLWSGVTVREIEVDVFNPEVAERTNHFHKLWDNARLWLLNFAFVLISLVRSHLSPGQLARAVGLGVAIGCSPLFGYHTMLVAVLGFFLRMNVLALLAGSLISLPALAPQLVISSILLGERLLGGKSLAPVASPMTQWLAGSLVVGVTLGFATFLVVYAMALAVRHRRRQSDGLVFQGGAGLGQTLARMAFRFGGQTAAYALAKPLAVYFYLFAAKGRQGLSEYYRLIKPELGFWRRQRLILIHFFRFGQIQIDRTIFAQPRGQKFKVRAFGLEHMTARPMVLSAHVGSWDLAARLAKVDATQLKKFNGDGPLEGRFELIPFLGRLAPFDVTPLVWAVQKQKPVAFSFGFKSDGEFYDFFVRTPKHYSFDGAKASQLQLYDWAQRYTETIEEFVRQYPDQWFNFFPFWSSIARPEKETEGQLRHHLIEELNTQARREPELRSGQKTSVEAEL